MSKFKLKMSPHTVGQKPTDENFLDFGVYRTKESIVNTLCSRLWGEFIGFSSDRHYSNVISFSVDGERVVRVYSLEKHRRKMKEITPRVLTKDEKRKFNTTDRSARMTREAVVSRTYWTAVYYDIPERVLKFFNIRVEQGNRTFTIKKPVRIHHAIF
jgi:hypothetical protein